MLGAANPFDAGDPALWPLWSLLLPHVMALDPSQAESPEFRGLVIDTTWSLLERGNARTALPLMEPVHREWSKRLGDRHPHTIAAALALGCAWRDLGYFDRSRQLHDHVLTVRRKLLGETDLATLNAKDNLAIDLHLLKDHNAARVLLDETLKQRRLALGREHQETLRSASLLASIEASLDNIPNALHLNKEILQSREGTLGADHPDTLAAIAAVADNYAALGQPEVALPMRQTAFEKQRIILGDDHPGKLSTANGLIQDLLAVGRHAEARQLREKMMPAQRRALGEDLGEGQSALQRVWIEAGD